MIVKIGTQWTKVIKRIAPPKKVDLPLLLLLTLTIFGCGDEVSESSRVERPAFDASRAFEDLVTQVDFGSRVPGTEAHQSQLEWMEFQLRKVADTVVLDPFDWVTAENDSLSLTNVIARFGTDFEQRILLLTHWDSRPTADQSTDDAEKQIPVPGANDGASGTAVLLELARMFSEQPPPVGVDLLFTDGEDYGPTTEDMFLGASYYANNRGRIDNPSFAILLDMVADMDPSFPVEAYSLESAPQVVQRVWTVASDLGYGRYFPMSSTSRVLDDHLKLIEVGIPTIDIIDFDYGPANSFWHTLKDVPENTSSRTLLMVGDVVAEVVYRSR
jgi:glutaminyl-peptide cyclotransferase